MRCWSWSEEGGKEGEEEGKVRRGEGKEEALVVHLGEDGGRARDCEVAAGGASEPGARLEQQGELSSPERTEAFDDDLVFRVSQSFDEESDEVLGEKEAESDWGQGEEEGGQSRLGEQYELAPELSSSQLPTKLTHAGPNPFLDLFAPELVEQVGHLALLLADLELLWRRTGRSRAAVLGGSCAGERARASAFPMASFRHSEGGEGRWRRARERAPDGALEIWQRGRVGLRG